VASEAGRGPAARRSRPGPLRWALRLAVALVLLELALQLAAPLYRSLTARDAGPTAADASLTVLCVGDSHTFGLHMPRAFSYPDRLAALLDRRFAAPVRVVNRGVPGRNSGQVATDLPADLREVGPDIVLILAGINDTWNRDAEGAGPSELLGRLKLVRLVRVLIAGVTSAPVFEVRSDERGQLVVDRGDGGKPVNTGAGAMGVRSGAELAASVERQLRRALGHVRDAGSRPVLMTYAENQGEFATVNQAIRSLARSEGVLLVDHERLFAPLFEAEGYETFMLNDHHPNARGYAQMAVAIDQALAEAGCVPGLAASRGEAAGPAHPPGAITAALACDEQGRLRLSGPPGTPFQLLIAAPAGEGGGFNVGTRHIPLQDDAMLALSRIEPTFSGQLDAGGSASIAVPAALRQAGAGSDWAACLVLLSRSADAPVTAVSPLVAIRL